MLSTLAGLGSSASHATNMMPVVTPMQNTVAQARMVLHNRSVDNTSPQVQPISHEPCSHAASNAWTRCCSQGDSLHLANAVTTAFTISSLSGGTSSRSLDAKVLHFASLKSDLSKICRTRLVAL